MLSSVEWEEKSGKDVDSNYGTRWELALVEGAQALVIRTEVNGLQVELGGSKCSDPNLSHLLQEGQNWPQNVVK